MKYIIGFFSIYLLFPYVIIATAETVKYHPEHPHLWFIGIGLFGVILITNLMFILLLSLKNNE
jgi:hypothetical protein